MVCRSITSLSIANHIVAKGIEKRLRKFCPEMNLLYLYVDGGMAEVNLQNRLHTWKLINDIQEVAMKVASSMK